MDGWTSARWKGEEELAAATRSTEDGEEEFPAAPRSTEDGEKVLQHFPAVLMVVVLLHAEQQQLKRSARAPKFRETSPPK